MRGFIGLFIYYPFILITPFLCSRYKTTSYVFLSRLLCGISHNAPRDTETIRPDPFFHWIGLPLPISLQIYWNIESIIESLLIWHQIQVH